MLHSTAHPLHQISAMGLLYGARLRHLPSKELANRIYGYYRTPALFNQSLQPSDCANLISWLNINGWKDKSSIGKSHYIMNTDVNGYWIQWRDSSIFVNLLHKLYISPKTELLPEIFPYCFQIFVDLDVPAFKIAGSKINLCRPDKLVAYVASREHLMVLAEEVRYLARIGIPVHGVPFTAPLDECGLLSWGFDPGIGTGSWRMHVAHAVADLLSHAPNQPVEEIVTSVVNSLPRLGVNPDSWEPIAEVLK